MLRCAILFIGGLAFLLAAGCSSSSGLLPPVDGGEDGAAADGADDGGADDGGADPGGDSGQITGPFQKLPLPARLPVRGLVRDIETGAPVAGAEVRLAGATLVTGADGRFSHEAARGKATLEVSAPDHLPLRRPLTVGAASPEAQVDLRRLPAPVVIGPAGGTLADGEAQLVFPAGAFPADTAVRAAWMPPAQAPAWSHGFQVRDAAGTNYRLVGVLAVEADAQPSSPVRARVPVSCGVPNPVLLEPGADGVWSVAGLSAGSGGGLHSFDLPHFSLFGVAEEAPPDWIIRRFSGEVYAYWVEGSWWTSLRVAVGAPLASGTIVRTCATGHVVLESPSFEFNLGPSAYVRLRKEWTEETYWDYLVQIFYGGLRDLMRTLDGEGGATVETSGTASGVRGTSLSVTSCPVAGALVEQILVDEGEVEVTTPDGAFTVTAGERLTNCPGCPLVIACPPTTDEAVLTGVPEAPDCQALGERCTSSVVCCPDTFCPGFADCLDGRVCCYSTGGSCATDRDCCNGPCRSGVCP